MYLDLGLVAARTFIVNMLNAYVTPDMLRNPNFKDQLRQYAHARGAPLPVYSSTPAGTGGFDIIVHACGITGNGWGRTKRDGEQEAAQNALFNFFLLSSFLVPVDTRDSGEIHASFA